VYLLSTLASLAVSVRTYAMISPRSWMLEPRGRSKTNISGSVLQVSRDGSRILFEINIGLVTLSSNSTTRIGSARRPRSHVLKIRIKRGIGGARKNGKRPRLRACHLGRSHHQVFQTNTAADAYSTTIIESSTTLFRTFISLRSPHQICLNFDCLYAANHHVL